MRIFDNPRSGSLIDLCTRSLRFNIFKFLFLKEKQGRLNHMEPPRDVRLKICSNIQGHVTKMANRPIYGKSIQKISFFGTKRPMTLKHGIQQRVLRYYNFFSNDVTGLTTLTIFMTWSYSFPNASTWVKAYTAYSHVFPILF